MVHPERKRNRRLHSDSGGSHNHKISIDPALKQWIIALVLVALLLGCLGAIAAMAGPGMDVPGQTTHVRLVSSVTQSPFCPPEDPRLSSMLLEQKRWIVCLIGESRPTGRAGRSMYKLVDIPLW